MAFASSAHLAQMLTGTIWDTLPESCLKELARIAELRSFLQDDVLPDGIFIVKQGIVCATRGPSLEGSAMMALYRDADLIDAHQLPTDQQDRLVALRPTRVLYFPTDAFHAAMQQSLPLATLAYRNLKQQVFNLREHVSELLAKAPEQRLAGFLLWLDESRDAGASPRTGFELPMRRYDLARYLGMQPETLSRKIKALAAQGAISQRSPSRLVIERRELLEQLAVGSRRLA